QYYMKSTFESIEGGVNAALAGMIFL
ncbi:uncharacterized protein METZ01_LOCUS263651, partial [marine metagenome]